MAGGGVDRERSRGELESRLIKGMFNGVSAAGNLVVQRAQDRAPVDRGHLARSVHRDEVVVVGPLTVATLIGVPSDSIAASYARAQEMGSGLYAEVGPKETIPIEPVFAKALAFEWPGGPKDHSAYDPESGLYFFQHVDHPGVRAQPYLRPALHESDEDIKIMILKAVKAELTR